MKLHKIKQDGTTLWVEENVTPDVLLPYLKRIQTAYEFHSSMHICPGTDDYKSYGLGDDYCLQLLRESIIERIIKNDPSTDSATEFTFVLVPDREVRVVVALDEKIVANKIRKMSDRDIIRFFTLYTGMCIDELDELLGIQCGRREMDNEELDMAIQTTAMRLVRLLHRTE